MNIHPDKTGWSLAVAIELTPIFPERKKNVEILVEKVMKVIGCSRESALDKVAFALRAPHADSQKMFIYSQKSGQFTEFLTFVGN